MQIYVKIILRAKVGNELQGNIVRKCVEKLDVLKVLNAKQKVPPSVVTTTAWETFEPSHNATQWELFD